MVLLVDDPPTTLAPVGAELRSLGYHPRYAADRDQAMAEVRRGRPALVIADLMHPDRSGLELCRLLRMDAATATIPIIIASGCADEIDRIVALEVGADDFVGKPFSVRELVLRAKRLMRAQTAFQAEAQPIEFDTLRIDPALHQVTSAGAPVHLTATEFRLLEVLVRRAGSVHRRQQLFGELWGSGVDLDSRKVDSHVRRLRRKLGAAGSLIRTIRGVGYRFGSPNGPDRSGRAEVRSSSATNATNAFRSGDNEPPDVPPA